jgi:hypothetical protein
MIGQRGRCLRIRGLQVHHWCVSNAPIIGDLATCWTDVDGTVLQEVVRPRAVV